MKSTVLAAIILSVSSSFLFAATPGINARQHVQSHRIFSGVQSGRLTYGETQRLMNGQNHVQNLKTQARSDGMVTPLERARIHTSQSVQSGRIYWNKHN